jgi:hypothetical protein
MSVSVLPEEELSRFRFNEVMLGCLFLWICFYAAQL